MSTPEFRLEALENQIAALQGRDAANSALLRMIARTLAHTAISSPNDVARTIKNWENFFEPIKTAELPDDHSKNDATKRNYFNITIESFFSEMREAVSKLPK